VAGVALAIGLLAPLVAPSAGAQIANAGDVTVSMHLSLFTPSFTVAGMSTMGTESATVRENGLVTIPQSSLSFQPVEVQVNLPDPPSGGSGTTGTSSPAVVTVQAVATSDFSGGLDPNNGSAFLVGNFELLWSSSTTMSNCTVGPFRVVVRSNAQGAIPYSAATGSTSMVDPGFTVNAIPNGSAGCGGDENAINNALSLPVTTTTTTTRPNQPAPPTTTDPTKGPPVPAVVLSLTFTPAPRAATPQPAVHQPHPTTTVAPTTTTVAPPSLSSPPPPQNYSPPPRSTSGGGSRRRKSVSKKVNHPPSSKKKRHPKPAAKPTKRITPKRRVRKPARKAVGTAKVAARPKAKKAAKSSAGRQLSFVPASFVKRSPSALATGLNLAGLLGLLVFSSLALWLVTSELSEFKAGARRQRMHRIAGVTDNR